MILLGGDSFLWGSELHDSPHGGPSGYSSKTFGALLSENKFICSAYPGLSNIDIVKNIKKYFTESVTGAIVCWTWPSRDDKLESDNEIIEIEDFFINKKIPYIFTCVDNIIVTGKIDYSHWYFFPPGYGPDKTESPRGFYQWAVEEGYKVGINGHPLEKAHLNAKKMMQEKYNELVKKYIQ